MRLLLAFMVAIIVATSCTLRGTDDLQTPASGGAGGAGGRTVVGPGGQTSQGGGGEGGCADGLAPCDGSCVDLMAHPEHCGVCDYSCGLGLCTAGSCEMGRQTGIFPTDGAGRSGAEHWFGGSASPNNGLWRVAYDGGGVELFQTGAIPRSIAVDDEHVYWGDTSITAPAVFRKSPNAPVGQAPVCFTNGTCPSQGTDAILSVALVGAVVYGIAGDDVFVVLKSDFDTTANVVPLYPDEPVADGLVATETNRLYWGTTDGIRQGRAPNPPTLEQAPLLVRPQRLALAPNDSTLCWAEWDVMLLASGPSLIACASLNGDGSLDAPVSFDADLASQVATDGTAVYWATSPVLAGEAPPSPGALKRRVFPLDSGTTDILFSAADADVVFVTLIGQELFFGVHRDDRDFTGTIFYRRHIDAPPAE